MNSKNGSGKGSLSSSLPLVWDKRTYKDLKDYEAKRQADMYEHCPFDDEPRRMEYFRLEAERNLAFLRLGVIEGAVLDFSSDSGLDYSYGENGVLGIQIFYAPNGKKWFCDGIIDIWQGKATIEEGNVIFARLEKEFRDMGYAFVDLSKQWGRKALMATDAEEDE